MSHPADLLAAAREYHGRGWSLIPTVGKKPLLRSWLPYMSNAAKLETIDGWFRSGKPDGIAVICGPVSGNLIVRDFDVCARYERWARAFPQLAKTLPTVRTARGYHVYLRGQPSRIITLGDGELRGKGYCLTPPSRHPTGTIYRWHVTPNPGPLPEVDPFACGLADHQTETTPAEEAAQSDRETEYTEETEAIVVGGVNVREAIRSTLPNHEGERNRKLFELARRLKAIARLADAKAGDLRDVVSEWHRRALTVIGTKPFDETWADFVYCWDKVRFPKGQNPMSQILANADSSPLPAVASRYDAPETHRLIRLCRELQRNRGAGSWFLSCRTAGRLLGIPHDRANRRLHMLAVDGVIRVVDRGTQTRAARYRYTAGDD